LLAKYIKNSSISARLKVLSFIIDLVSVIKLQQIKRLLFKREAPPLDTRDLSLNTQGDLIPLFCFLALV